MEKIIHIVRLGVFGVLVGALAILTLPYEASADVEDLTTKTGCSQVVSYTASLTPEQADYDVYVRLPRRGQVANVTTYSQSFTQSYGECTAIGEVQASGDHWVKAGTTSLDGDTYTLQVSSSVFKDTPDANRPSLMLVPASGSICQPTDECRFTIGESEAYLRPASTIRNEHSLQAFVVSDPALDEIKQVRYFVDGKMLYVKPKLEPFDMRYVSYGGQLMTRVIVYGSGQQAVIDNRAPADYSSSFSDFVFRTVRAYPETLRILGVLLAVAVVFIAVMASAGILKSRHDRRVHHGFVRSGGGKMTDIYYAIVSSKAVRIIRMIGLFGGLAAVTIAGIVLVSAFVVQIISVDGRSMQRAYKTGDSVLVNKIPRTMAGLNGRDYIPKRGEVVIVNAQFGGNELDETQADDSLLIKRVLALPGERIVIKDGVLTVYNEAHKDGFVPDKGSAWASTMTADLPTESIDLTLGPGELFVSGDNRPESIDSRFNGPLAMRNVVGVVVAKW